MCVSKFFCKFKLVEKAEPHTSQENSFSRVSLHVAFQLKKKADPQTLQDNDSSLMGVAMCVFHLHSLEFTDFIR